MQEASLILKAQLSLFFITLWFINNWYIVLCKNVQLLGCLNETKTINLCATLHIHRSDVVLAIQYFQSLRQISKFMVSYQFILENKSCHNTSHTCLEKIVKKSLISLNCTIIFCYVQSAWQVSIFLFNELMFWKLEYLLDKDVIMLFTSISNVYIR